MAYSSVRCVTGPSLDPDCDRSNSHAQFTDPEPKIKFGGASTSRRGALVCPPKYKRIVGFTSPLPDEDATNASDAIKTHYALAFRTIAMNTEGMSHDDSIRQPAPAGNCANWIVGHVTAVQNEVMKLLGETPAWDSEALTRTAAPISSEAEAIDWKAMLTALLGAEERCLAAIDRLSPEKLDEPGYPNPLGGELTFGELLNFLAFHQCYHAGQIGMSRRLAGLDGVIKGPQERAQANA